MPGSCGFDRYALFGVNIVRQNPKWEGMPPHQLHLFATHNHQLYQMPEYRSVSFWFL
jgi:hypothetical protein